MADHQLADQTPAEAAAQYVGAINSATSEALGALERLNAVLDAPPNVRGSYIAGSPEWAGFGLDWPPRLTELGVRAAGRLELASAFSPSTEVNRRPVVGYGHQHEHDALIVACPRCRADKDVPCSYQGSAARYHVVRVDRARRLIATAARRMAGDREGEALERDANTAPVWTSTPLGHRCGTKGAHLLGRECRELDERNPT